MKLYPPLHGNYPISQRFGENPQDYTQFNLAGHAGVDWSCPEGTAVYSSSAGKVVIAGWNDQGFGNLIKVIIDDEHSVYYAHLSLVACQVNQIIEPGQYIGKTGNTGNSSGPHLHFEVRRLSMKDNGYRGAIDPLPLLSYDQTGDDRSSESAVDDDIKEGDRIMVSTPGGINLRLGADKNFNLIGRMPEGTELTVDKIVTDESGNKWGIITPIYMAIYYNGEWWVAKTK